MLQQNSNTQGAVNTQGTVNAPVQVATPQAHVGSNAPIGALPQGAQVVPVQGVPSKVQLSKAVLALANGYAAKPVTTLTVTGKLQYHSWAAKNTAAQAPLALLVPSACIKRTAACACYHACKKLLGDTPQKQVIGCAALLLLVCGAGTKKGTTQALVGENRTTAQGLKALTGYIALGSNWWANSMQKALGDKANAAYKLLTILVGDANTPNAVSNALWAYVQGTNK